MVKSINKTSLTNSGIVYMLYDDELYMLKSNKIYVMLCYLNTVECPTPMRTIHTCIHTMMSQDWPQDSKHKIREQAPLSLPLFLSLSLSLSLTTCYQSLQTVWMMFCGTWSGKQASQAVSDDRCAARYLKEKENLSEVFLKNTCNALFNPYMNLLDWN